MNKKTAAVSGCFDLFHSGHVQFLKTAAEYGSLTVAVGSDNTVEQLKGRVPYYNEVQRLETVKACRYVAHAFIASGSGELDFMDDLFNSDLRDRPDIFIVNRDGASDRKQELCREYDTKYVVLNREPAPGLEAVSTSETLKKMLPYRLDIAGGWLDQPMLSSIHKGSVIVASLEPSREFNRRSGMATSTRDSMFSIWGGRLPRDREECGYTVLL